MAGPIRCQLVVLVTLFLSVPSTAALAQSSDDLFNGDVLQEIRIQLNPQDWETLKANPASDDYYRSNFKWHGIELSNVGIKQHGGSTRNRIKPSLHIDFNKYQSKQEFLGLKSLIMANMAQDASMMRDRLSMELFSKMGVPVPREAHARLYINDQYAGLYTAVESTDKNFLQQAFGENDGYLYDFVKSGNYRFEYLGSDPSLYSPKYFDPKTHEKDPAPAPIEAMIRTMNAASDTDFPAAMAPYLDLKGFMKHLAIEDFLAETDGILSGMSNFYLYRFENTNLSELIPKDKDLTFGGPPTNANRYSTPFLLSASQNVLIRRAMNTAAARNAYLDTLRNVAVVAGANGGWLESEITRIYSQIRSAAYEDAQKMCFDGLTQRSCSNSDFEAEVSANLDFARRRSGFAISRLPELSNELFFAITKGGGFALTNGDAAKPISAGYAVIQPDTSSPNPEGIAILSLRQNGTLVSETSIPPVSAIQHGIVYAEIAGRVMTSIAIANTSDQPATISFSYLDANGITLTGGTVVLPAGVQIARSLDDDPFDLGGGSARGTFTFVSSIPVFVQAFRGLTNERGEFILSAVPVIDPSMLSQATVIPHFADGNGWATQVVLTNPSSDSMQGTIQFFNQAMVSTFSYTISPRGYYRMETSGTAEAITTGAVRIVPALNTGSPAAFGIVSFRSSGVTVTEASLQAVPMAQNYRAWFEMSDNVQTAIAIANPSPVPAIVSIEALTLSGAPAGFSGTLTIPGNGEVSSFIEQIPGFETIGRLSQGILRVSTSAANGIAAVGLRTCFNERHDFLIAAIPMVVDNAPSATTQRAFPYFVQGGGYATQFNLFGGGAALGPSGILRMSNGRGLPVSPW